MKGALKTKLQSVAAITNLLKDATSVYSAPVKQLRAIKPYITLQRITEVPNHEIVAPSGWTETLWQVNAYADTDLAAEALKEQIRIALDHVNHTTWTDGGTSQVFTIYGVYLDGVTDLWQMNDDGSIDSIDGKAMTFRIKHSQPQS